MFGQQPQHSDKWGVYELSTSAVLFCCAALFALSNHWPASLLSPELCLLRTRGGDALEGGLALSESDVRVLASGPRVDLVGTEADEAWRRVTDLCAGARRAVKPCGRSMLGT